MALPQIDVLAHGLGSDYAGGTATGYDAGTSTKSTYWYTDSGGTTPAANPITLDADGKAVIYSGGRLKIDVKDVNGVSAPGFPVNDIYTGFANTDVTYNTVTATTFTGALVGTATLATDTDATGSIPYAASEDGLRIIRGIVSNAGAVSFGSGFTAAKNSTGNYTVTFSSPFGNTATITANAYSTGSLYCALQGTPANDAITLKIYDAAGTLTDAVFGFIAIGPNA